MPRQIKTSLRKFSFVWVTETEVLRGSFYLDPWDHDHDTSLCDPPNAYEPDSKSTLNRLSLSHILYHSCYYFNLGLLLSVIIFPMPAIRQPNLPCHRIITVTWRGAHIFPFTTATRRKRSSLQSQKLHQRMPPSLSANNRKNTSDSAITTTKATRSERLEANFNETTVTGDQNAWVASVENVLHTKRQCWRNSLSILSPHHLIPSPTATYASSTCGRTSQCEMLHGLSWMIAAWQPDCVTSPYTILHGYLGQLNLGKNKLVRNVAWAWMIAAWQPWHITLYHSLRLPSSS